MSAGVDTAFFTMRALFGPAFTLAFRLKSEGQHHVPRDGAAILAANHASFLDPIFIGIRARRTIRFLVSREFYANPRLQPVLRFFGTIPVGGRGGMIRSYRRTAEILERGGLLGIFPEGGISRDGGLQPFRDGAAVIALRTGVPVVPVHVRGTFEALPRYAKWPSFVPVTVSFGAPIPVTANRSPSDETVASLTQAIRSAIETLAAA